MTSTVAPAPATSTDARGWYPDGEQRLRSRLIFLDVMNRSDSEIESWPQLIAYLASEIVEHLRTPAFVADHLSSRMELFADCDALTDRLIQGGTLTRDDWIAVDRTVNALDFSNVESMDLGALVGAALVATWPTGPAGLDTWLEDAVRYAGLDPTPLETTP